MGALRDLAAGADRRRDAVHEARKADPDFRKRKRAEAPPDGDFPGAEQERATEGSAPEDDWEAELAAAIEEMNGRYFVAQQGGRALICSLAYDDALGRERLVFSRKEDVKLLYNHRHYQVGFTAKGNPVWKDLGTGWIEDWRRRTYDRLALLPNAAAPPGVYNLWRGWGVEPKAGGWPLFREHVLEIVCARRPGPASTT